MESAEWKSDWYQQENGDNCVIWALEKWYWKWLLSVVILYRVDISVKYAIEQLVCCSRNYKKADIFDLQNDND